VGDHTGIPGTVVVFSFLIAFAVYVSPHRSVPSTVGSSNPYAGNRFALLTGFAVYFVQPTWVDPEVPAVRVGLRLESSGRNGSSSCRQGYLTHQRDGSTHWFTWSVESQLGRPPLSDTLRSQVPRTPPSPQPAPEVGTTYMQRQVPILLATGSSVAVTVRCRTTLLRRPLPSTGSKQPDSRTGQDSQTARQPDREAARHNIPPLGRTLRGLRFDW
jgi:hypothetical protein